MTDRTVWFVFVRRHASRHKTVRRRRRRYAASIYVCVAGGGKRLSLARPPITCRRDEGRDCDVTLAISAGPPELICQRRMRHSMTDDRQSSRDPSEHVFNDVTQRSDLIRLPDCHVTTAQRQSHLPNAAPPSGPLTITLSLLFCQCCCENHALISLRSHYL